MRQQRDPMAEADALCALRDGPEEHLRRGGVCEFGQKMMLHLPDGVVTELVGKDDLLERLVIAAVLAALVVRLRHLELVEEVEFHRRTVCDVLAVPCKPRRGGVG